MIIIRLSLAGAPHVEISDDEELNQWTPEPDDETEASEVIEESENEEVSSAPTEGPPPAKPAPAAPSPRGRPRRTPAKRDPVPAPAPSPGRTRKPPPAAPGQKKTAPAPAARSKTPPPAARPKSADTNGSMDATYRKSAGLMKLISDPTRLAIVDILRSGEMNVTDLCERLGLVSQPAVSHHLALLRHGRIIEPRRTGKHNFYSLTEEYGNVLADLVEEITAA